MKPTMRMMLLAEKDKRNNYPRNGDDRRWTITEDNYSPYNGGYEEPIRYNMPSMGYNEPYVGREYDVPENRRYKNGRFAPMRGNYDPSMHYGNRMGHEPMQIGFAGEYDSEMPFNQMTAEKWTHEMENEDGSKGPHWNIEQVKMLMGQKGIAGDPWEFYAAINAMYSDYGKVLKKHGVGDKLDVYIDMAKAFMDDKDAQPDKLARYYKYIVKH